MSEKKKFFDVWLISNSAVYKAVPFEVVTDWLEQGRLLEDDRIRPTGTNDWFVLGNVPVFKAYIPKPDELHPDDRAEALEPVEAEFHWKQPEEDGDNDPDMIPLIDISLVLLIFFMMTSTVAAIAGRINVPDASNAGEMTANVNMVWIGIKHNGDGVPPGYSIAFDSEHPKPEDAELQMEELLKRLDEGIARSVATPEVRVAADKQIMFRLIQDVSVELQTRKNNKKIGALKVEVGDKKK